MKKKLKRRLNELVLVEAYDVWHEWLECVYKITFGKRVLFAYNQVNLYLNDPTREGLLNAFNGSKPISHSAKMKLRKRVLKERKLGR